MGDDIKAVIMAATFQLLKKKDMNSISIREIARQADVNVAAISYYYGGKAELFAAMMEQYWEDLRQLCLEILQCKPMTKERAKEFCLKFLHKEMSSTGILRSEQIMYQNYEVDPKTKERIQLQFQAFAYLIRSCSKEVSDLGIQIRIVALLSALAQPAFWSEIAEQMVGEKEQFMKAYVDELIDQL